MSRSRSGVKKRTPTESGKPNQTKHVVVVSCVYPPEPVVSSQTSAQIAEALSSNKHAVTVVTSFPNRPAGKLFPGFSRKLAQQDRSVTDVKVIRCFSTLSPESRLLSRLLENLSFGLTSGWQVLTSERPDVIYANTWPIFATGIIALVAKLRNIPLAISVQDVYPESLIVQGRIKANSLLDRILGGIDGWIARSAQAVIVISQTFREIYVSDRKVPENRIYFVPNWIDSETIDSTIPQAEFRKRFHIPSTGFVFTYGGNIGAAAGVEDVIRAFLRLQDEDDLFLLIAGDGSRLAACREISEKPNTRRIIFHTPWTQDETSPVLRTADVLLLPTMGDQSLASVPSKLIAYMLAARPIIAMALPQSDLAKVIQEVGCGWVIEPGRADRLVEIMLTVAEMPKDELARRGQAGRDYALNHLVSSVNLPIIMDILESAR